MNPDLVLLAAKCTKKQREFAQHLASGLNNSEAYRRAYNTTQKDKGLASKAAHTKVKPKVQAYLNALIAHSERKALLTRERKREVLATVVESSESRPADRIKAIEVDNVMTGDNAPQQVQVFGLGDLLQLVRKGNR